MPGRERPRTTLWILLQRHYFRCRVQTEAAFLWLGRWALGCVRPCADGQIRGTVPRSPCCVLNSWSVGVRCHVGCRRNMPISVWMCDRRIPPPMALPETMLNWKSHKQKQPWLGLLSKLGHLQQLRHILDRICICLRRARTRKMITCSYASAPRNNNAYFLTQRTCHAY
jgi:hypothetical protein